MTSTSPYVNVQQKSPPQAAGRLQIFLIKVGNADSPPKPSSDGGDDGDVRE
jgi:hypothetical protein